MSLITATDTVFNHGKAPLSFVDNEVRSGCCEKVLRGMDEFFGNPLVDFIVNCSLVFMVITTTVFKPSHKVVRSLTISDGGQEEDKIFRSRCNC